MIKQEIIWITGASSGIGKALALQLAQQGNKIIASGRNRNALTELALESDHIQPFIFDLLTENKESLKQSLSELSYHLDRVILCAGDCQYLDAQQEDWSCIETMMQLNFHGSILAIQAALPLLEKSDRGHIVGISSMASLAPFTQAEAYGASKAAFSYFLSSLRIDLYNKGIDVSDIKPGFIDTPLTQKNTFSMPFLMSSAQASSRIIKAIEKRQYLSVFPKPLWLLFKLISFIPKTWMHHNAKTMAAESSNAKKEMSNG